MTNILQVGDIVRLESGVLGEVIDVSSQDVTVQEIPILRRSVRPQHRVQNPTLVLRGTFRIQNRDMSPTAVADELERCADPTQPMKAVQIIGFAGALRMFAEGDIGDRLKTIGDMLELPEFERRFKLEALAPLNPVMRPEEIRTEFTAKFGLQPDATMDRIIAHIVVGNYIQAMKDIRQLTGCRLNPAQDFLNWARGVNLPRPEGQRTVCNIAEFQQLVRNTCQYMTMVDSYAASILMHIQAGDKIEAIKMIRAATGLGLKEAKDLMERAIKPQG